MNTSFYIAKRYLFSKKSLNAINFISGISMLGVFVGSAALVIILSVFNGFENVVLSMYNNFTPEIRIEPATGKTFDPGTEVFKKLKADKRIENYTEVLQEKALLRYGDSQFIGLVKGVSSDFFKRKRLDSTLVEGDFKLKQDDSTFYAAVGSSVKLYLTVNINDDFTDLQIFSPRKNAGISINPAQEFVARSIHPVGVFQIQQVFDESVLVPIEFTRALLEEEKAISTIEIYSKAGEDLDDLQQDFEKQLGKEFLVKNRIQQDQQLYKTLNIERWAIFFILTFVMIIAIFNIVGTLTMLVIDKKKDIAILSSIGAGTGLIRQIFFIEGMMIALTGCLAGMFAGFIFCVVQQKFGLITMGQDSFITDAYPVAMKLADFVLVFLTVTLISIIASGISSRLSVNKIYDLKEDL
ncbi:MAG: ABC transporter permease [Sphingobacteriaceae bacterium]|nr:ABC transporter permease [Sphingobacteriaceae bacterium]